MEPDCALILAWELGLDDAGWTEEVMEQADRLLPVLVDAGYVASSETHHSWWFTQAGVARTEALEALITQQQAVALRCFRVEERLNWSEVAARFCEHFGDSAFCPELAGEELAGMFLCDAAARRLGEDDTAAPWV